MVGINASKQPYTINASAPRVCRSENVGALTLVTEKIAERIMRGRSGHTPARW